MVEMMLLFRIRKIPKNNVYTTIRSKTKPFSFFKVDDFFQKKHLPFSYSD